MHESQGKLKYGLQTLMGRFKKKGWGDGTCTQNQDDMVNNKNKLIIQAKK